MTDKKSVCSFLIRRAGRIFSKLNGKINEINSTFNLITESAEKENITIECPDSVGEDIKPCHLSRFAQAAKNLFCCNPKL